MIMEIQAGARLDLLTPTEARDLIGEMMTGWRTEIARGTRYRHPGFPGVANGVGVLSVAVDASLGPDPGFVWSVTSIFVGGITAAQVVAAYIGDTSGVLQKAQFTAGSPLVVFGQRGLILNSAERLVFAGAGLTAGGAYPIAMEVTELPVQLASRLL